MSDAPDIVSSGGRRRSAKQASWMAHVKATMRAHPGKKLKEVLKMAKKTYKKVAKRGGGQGAGLVLTPGGATQTAAGRGRRHGKTRRARRGGSEDGDDA